MLGGVLETALEYSYLEHAIRKIITNLFSTGYKME